MKFSRNFPKIMLVTMVYLILIMSTISNGANAEMQSNSALISNQKITLSSEGGTVFTPTIDAELTTRTRTKNFIEQTRALPENNATSLDSIYYRLLALQVLDPSLNNISSEIKDYWINQVLSFQNPNGGFGGWLKDTSSISNTYKSLKILKILNYDIFGMDIPLITGYIERLRNLLTDGYNSKLSDGDSDVLSTNFAVKAYSILGVIPPSPLDVENMIIRSQNLDGGFGQQTNNVKGIYWTSEVSTTFRALEALDSLNSTANDTIQATSFIQGVQAGNGGFTNNELSIVVTLPYTSSAIQGLSLLSSSPNFINEAYSYILSLENPNGSFKSKETNINPSLTGTYFAILGLNKLNGSFPTDITKTIDYLIDFSYTTDGYGGYPGEEPTLRETFDGVAALNNMGEVPVNHTGITDYVATYRNLDGGYGISTLSYLDGTNRVVNIYNLLGVNYPDPSSTITFLQDLQLASGGFAKKPLDATPLVVSTYRAVLSLSLLGAQPISTTNAITYLKSVQNTDGGFGGFVGDTSDITSTYRAIRALGILGDSSFDKAAAISFIQESQNPDGGYKRSNYDVIRPSNISHAVYTYSAARSLLLLGALPTNVTGLYYYVESLRNTDGGFAEHPKFTSDNAYTFTSMWVLSNFDEISQFSLSVPDNLNQIRSNYDNFQLKLLGSTKLYNYTVSNLNTSQVIINGLSEKNDSVLIDTSTYSLGTHQLNLYVFDFTGASINQSISLLISDVISDTSTDTTTITNSSPPETTSLPDTIIIFAGAAGLLVVIVLILQVRSGKKN